jgi:Domain of unknown function (DUF1772)
VAETRRPLADRRRLDFRLTRTVLELLQILSVILAALALLPALAHALEMPGKLRLSKDAYLTAQTIYYPGFTIAGAAEPLALLVTAILLATTPRGGAAFWLTAAALAGLAVMHAVYWIFTHPVNKVWLQGESLGAAGSRFFSLASGKADEAEWTRLRDRWEYSHVARAALAAISFVALVIAASISG